MACGLMRAAVQRIALTMVEAHYGAIVHAVAAARDFACRAPLTDIERAQLDDSLKRIGVLVPTPEGEAG